MIDMGCVRCKLLPLQRVEGGPDQGSIAKHDVMNELAHHSATVGGQVMLVAKIKILLCRMVPA